MLGALHESSLLCGSIQLYSWQLMHSCLHNFEVSQNRLLELALSIGCVLRGD